MHRDIHAGLLNAALGVGWKPPSGEAWKPEMLKPGYVAAPPVDDWRTQKAVFAAMAAKQNPPSIEERKQRKQAVRDRSERSKRALEAAARGVTGRDIQLIMEGRA